MSFKKHLKTYLSFSSSERRALTVLLTILLGVFLYPSFISTDEPPVWEQNSEEQKRLDSLLSELTEKSKSKGRNLASHKLFSFDPNQIDSVSLLSLGFPNYVIKNLLAYRKSGANIAKKTDLMKIYGMTKALYDRLEPFIKIDSKNHFIKHKYKQELKPFDLNKVDSVDLLGLGFSKFQTRNFLRYRKQFGQFTDKEELKKVYGISSSDFKKYEYFIRIESNKRTYLFSFDPNLISRNGWDSLGVSLKLIDRINKFLLKGGKFRTPQDLKKIYGFDSLKYFELEPYIDIVSDLNIENILIDLNSADSILLKTLPGIGSYFARQIINYRVKLGGYYNVNQLSDIRGLRMSRVDSIRKYISLDTFLLQSININKASFNELNNHPYISYREASDIVRLRTRKGMISNFDILKKKRVFTNLNFERIEPYLVLE